MSLLFQPKSIGELCLRNRIVMAPMGRLRCEALTHEPGPSVVTYYGQRASAGMIVSEACHVMPESGPSARSAAMFENCHEAAWASVVTEVHRAGGRIFQQLFHRGRKGIPSYLPPGSVPVGPSPVPARGTYSTNSGILNFPVPRALVRGEIGGIIKAFRAATERSKRSGFDGIEIHAANGYLLDQFLRDSSNHRDDSYGGSIEKRARLLLEVIDQSVEIFGASRIGVRLSPHPTRDGTFDSNPTAAFEYLASEFERRNIGYVHLVEGPSISIEQPVAPLMRRIFGGILILCGGFDRYTASSAVVEDRADLIAFGVPFIANPDLVRRMRLGIALNVPDRDTFYRGGDRGYIDYPAAG